MDKEYKIELKCIIFYSYKTYIVHFKYKEGQSVILKIYKKLSIIYADKKWKVLGNLLI